MDHWTVRVLVLLSVSTKYAVDTGKYVLAFLHGEPKKLSVERSDIDPIILQKLESFREEVSGGRLVKFWTSRENLESSVTKSLSRTFSDHPALGWARVDQTAGTEILSQVNDLRKKNSELQKQIAVFTVNKPLDIPDIAAMNEKFTVRYNKFTNDSWNASSSSLTWSQLFFAI